MSRDNGVMTLFGRVFVINALLFITAALVLALSPATIHTPLRAGEFEVLVAGLGAVLLVDFLLVRRAVTPLERLTGLMGRVDLLHPGARLPPAAGSREVTDLTSAFNDMIARLERERAESGRRAIDAQEQERRRLALELHDEVGQLLTGVVLGLDGLTRQVPDTVRPRVTELQGFVRTGAEQVREMARGLRPQSLEQLGLRSAIVGLSATAERAGLQVERDLAGHLPALPADTELVVYRVAQESLTNILRHAEATHVRLGLAVDGDALELRVEDDGRGISEGELGSDGGLRGMRERAVAVSGRLSVTRRRDAAGTVVALRIPVGEDAA